MEARSPRAFRVSLALFLVSALIWSGVAAAAAAPTAGEATRIRSIRIGVHERFTRLVFDAEGAKPVRVDGSRSGETRILFGRLDAPLPVKSYPKSRLLSKVTSEAGAEGTAAVVRHRTGPLQVKADILAADPPRAGSYRLVLDFSRASSESKPASSPEAPVSGQPGSGPSGSGPPPRAGSGMAVEPAAQPSAAPPAVALASAPAQTDSETARQALVGHPNGMPEPHSADRTQAQQSAEPAGSGAVPSLAVGLAEGDSAPLKPPGKASGADLYREANDYFEAHQSELSGAGKAILDRYKAAMAAAPSHADHPLALYRCGTVAAAMGGQIMAEGYLRRLISQYPHHDLVGPAWLQIAKGKHQSGQYADAIKAFHSALNGKLSAAERLAAEYYAGACLTMVGEHQQAIAALEKCLAQDPKYYLTQPEILLNLGESYFAAGNYDASRKLLFWYLNLGEKDPKSQHLILARLAESLRNQGETRLAQRLTGYIQSYLPNTDGDIISRIREAEQLEQKGGSGMQAALAVYEELARRGLSDNLMRLVKFRLAASYGKLGETERGLAVVQQVFDANPGESTLDEFYPLQRDLLKDLIRKAYAAGNFLQVAALDQNNEDLLHMEADPEIDPLIAGAYQALKLYPIAVTLYLRLIAADRAGSDRWRLEAARCSLEMRDLSGAMNYCNEIRDAALEEAKTGLMARIYFARRQYAEASAQFNRFLQGQKDLNRLDWQVLLDHVACLMALDRPKEALVALQKTSEHPAAREEENRLNLCLLLGQCYEAMNQPKEALPFLEEALQLIADRDRKDYVIYKIAKLHKSVGQIDRAREMFTLLSGSGQSLWQAVAQEELNDITIARASF